jgi:hypothetical protein
MGGLGRLANTPDGIISGQPLGPDKEPVFWRKIPLGAGTAWFGSANEVPPKERQLGKGKTFRKEESVRQRREVIFPHFLTSSFSIFHLFSLSMARAMEWGARGLAPGFLNGAAFGKFN